MNKSAFFLALGILIFGIPRGLAFASSSCEASKNSCEFYSCLESEKPCGEDGYTLHFGKQLCERYLEAEPQTSSEVQEWLPRVRECLQDSLRSLKFPTTMNDKACSKLKEFAFRSHDQCYLQTGFCELSFSDKFEILRIAGFAALTPASLQVSLQIQAACSIMSAWH